MSLLFLFQVCSLVGGGVTRGHDEDSSETEKRKKLSVKRWNKTVPSTKSSLRLSFGLSVWKEMKTLNLTSRQSKLVKRGMNS